MKMVELNIWRPKNWEDRYFKKPGDPLFRKTLEFGADAMHLEDVEYLEEHKVLVNFMEEGKARITFDFLLEEWLAFTGKEVV